SIKHWSQMVDYWAVDWDFKDDTFHNQWQSYRTRKNPKLELSTKHEYLDPREIYRRDQSDRHTGKRHNVDTKCRCRVSRPGCRDWVAQRLQRCDKYWNDEGFSP